MAHSDEVKSQHFLKEMEQAIQVANREILSQRLPPMVQSTGLSREFTITLEQVENIVAFIKTLEKVPIKRANRKRKR